MKMRRAPGIRGRIEERRIQDDKTASQNHDRELCPTQQRKLGGHGEGGAAWHVTEKKGAQAAGIPGLDTRSTKFG